MSNTQNIANPLGYERIGKLLKRYAVPSIISLIINSLYNMVDQIFICQSTGPRSPEKPVFSRCLRLVGLPFSLDFSLMRKFKGKPRQPLLTTLSRSLALERFASLVAWA